VRSKDLNSGLISEPASFSFTVIPAIYQTVWFRTLIIILLASALIGFFFWRVRSIRLHEAEQRDFQHQLAELEMTALRAQMNPHFLFNSLNSVNGFIIKNKKEEASEYLTKFSRLVRMVLQNSQEKLVSLEDELAALKLYIQMESLRFKDEFHYVEMISPNVDLKAHKLPPLLLQPYVENAIWHGLLHLNGRKGKLTLSIEAKPQGVIIKIADNGVGREKSEMMKSKSAMKRKSMGMQINSDRMGLSQELYDFKISVDIEDIVSGNGQSEGTLVTINIIEHAA
jgi:LytS/YehU family sensor histidine kinase